MMRCFLHCFSSSKRQNHFSSKKPAYTNSISIQPTDLEESIHWISESKIENNEEKSQCVNNNDLESKELALKEEKKTKTPQCKIETKDNHEEERSEECSDSLFSVSIGCGKPEENEVNSSTPIKLHHAKDEAKDLEEENREEEEKGKVTMPMNKSILEYRYRDCSDDDDDLYNEKIGEEERSSESSLFSLSTDYKNCRKRISFSSTEKEVDNEVSSVMVSPQGEESEGNNIPDDVCSSVLNPIENVNLVKVKVVKATMLHSAKKDKENMNWIQAETSLKLSSSNRKMKGKEEIGVVDTSLSSWLVESEKNHTPKKGCYGEDRPILGALTFEEIKKYSPSNMSSKSSTSLSPEDTPIIGTVGSYWNHSGQRKSSKSNKHGKDGKHDWSSTTIIKTRLEPAFEASVTQN